MVLTLLYTLMSCAVKFWLLTCYLLYCSLFSLVCLPYMLGAYFEVSSIVLHDLLGVWLYIVDHLQLLFYKDLLQYKSLQICSFGEKVSPPSRSLRVLQSVLTILPKTFSIRQRSSIPNCHSDLSSFSKGKKTLATTVRP